MSHFEGQSDPPDLPAGGGELDTTPDCQPPPEEDIRAAERDLPPTLNDMRNAEGCGVYAAPPAGHKAVIASLLVDKLGAKNHSRAAVMWAIHRLICSRMLQAEIPRRMPPCVLTEPPAWLNLPVPEHLKYPELGSPGFSGPVPYHELLIRSTDALWEQWRSEREASPGPATVSDQAAAGQGEEVGAVKLAPSRQKAYEQYRWALRMNTALQEARDQEVYDWLKERPDEDEELPRFDTWQRYLGEARAAYGTRKHNPRAGRESGRSVIRPDEI
jgi:hypothetical protein